MKRVGNWRNVRTNKKPQPKTIKARQAEITLVDRSFTDLGYIGFESGIDT